MGSYRIGAAIYLGRSLNSSSAVGTALLITQTQFAKLFEFCTWDSAQNNTDQSNTESQTALR
jgi:hypothetical protein